MKERKLKFWDLDEWKRITKNWPTAVAKGFSTRLRVVQQGSQPASRAKPMSGFKITVWELWHRDGQRVIYTTHYAEVENCVYVLDAFEKDSREGKGMRISDRTRIEGRIARLKDEVERIKAASTPPGRLLH